MNAKQKAMVLAVGAALAAPCVQAQVTSKANSEWDFYGKFYPELTHMSGKDNTVGTTVSTLSRGLSAANTPGFTSRWEMQVNNTYIGFRGHKDLGSGLRGIWQLETAVAIDEANGDPLANRNSFVGLAGNFGTVRLGNMDTPFKEAGDELGFLSVSSGNFVSTSNIMRKVGFNNNSAASFHLRRANSIDFTSPEFFGGLTYRGAYSIGAPDEAGTFVNGRQPRVASMSVVWEKGPWYLAAAHEAHFDLFGGSNQFAVGNARRNTEDTDVHSKDNATQLTAEYKIGVHAIEVDYIVKQYKEDADSSSTATAGRFMEYKNTAWMVVWQARWSKQWRTAAHYLKANEGSCKQLITSCTTTGLGGTQISAGVSYYLDPNFFLYGLYSVVNNGDGAVFENLESGRPSVGTTITQGAVGVTYTF
jgi:predicted porin